MSAPQPSPSSSAKPTSGADPLSGLPLKYYATKCQFNDVILHCAALFPKPFRVARLKDLADQGVDTAFRAMQQHRQDGLLLHFKDIGRQEFGCQAMVMAEVTRLRAMCVCIRLNDLASQMGKQEYKELVNTMPPVLDPPYDYSFLCNGLRLEVHYLGNLDLEERHEKDAVDSFQQFSWLDIAVRDRVFSENIGLTYDPTEAMPPPSVQNRSPAWAPNMSNEDSDETLLIYPPSSPVQRGFHFGTGVLSPSVSRRLFQEGPTTSAASTRQEQGNALCALHVCTFTNHHYFFTHRYRAAKRPSSPDDTTGGSTRSPTICPP